MVELDNKYVMDANENCYMLKVKTYTKDKDGKQKTDDAGNAVVSYSTVGYYTTVHDVFRAWYNELLMAKTREETREAADFVTAVRNTYKMVCATLNREIPKLSK